MVGGGQMASSVTRVLIITATTFSGFLAGANMDRIVIQMPAWRRVGVRAWAKFSRRADLGNGLIVYPLELAGATIFTVAAAMALHRDRSAARHAMLPIVSAAILEAGGLLATTQAAPQMLSLRRIGDDRKKLRRAFRQFDHWGGIRAVFQILAFGMHLWALASLR